MKRSLALALGLLLALTVLGVAWAAWGATLYIKTSVAPAAGLEVGIEIVEERSTGGGVLTAAVDDATLTLTIGVTDARPSETYEVDLVFENKGQTGIRVQRNSTGQGDVNADGVMIGCSVGLGSYALSDGDWSILPLESSDVVTVTVQTTSAFSDEYVPVTYTFQFDAVTY